MVQEEQVRTVPVTTQKPVTERVTRYVPEQRTRWVPQQMVRKVPVTTVRYVQEERVEQIPVRTCRMVTEYQTVEVPRTNRRWVAETSTRMVPRTVMMRIPLESPVTSIPSYAPNGEYVVPGSVSVSEGTPTPAAPAGSPEPIIERKDPTQEFRGVAPELESAPDSADGNIPRFDLSSKSRFDRH